ncbi:hypothetical protein VP01_1115g3 [Puccinia sorghi]|uniref:Uncharacterized protein n=1 Tax=Puccinia sorghi TaxID=27349 RepID=A0A0L6VSJ0_9BASI|nr:hypothetical protein VP01_1115g3 [Puccinia sorghi]
MFARIYMNGAVTSIDLPTGTESSGRSDVALVAFAKLISEYSFSLNQICCLEQEDLTLDQLDEKIHTWIDLRTRLLPRMKSQIVTLLQSLALSEPLIHPCPNPESTANILTEIHDTLNEARSAVVTLALEPPLPCESHDQHLKEFKRFRMSRILWKTKAVIQEILCDLFESCAVFILMWDGEGIDVEDKEFQTKSVNSRKHILSVATKSGCMIDEILEWSKLSDLAILQDEWQGLSRKLHRMLVALTEMINGRYVWRTSPGQNHDGKNETENNTAHRTRAIQLTRATIPMVKLARLFYDTLSNTTAHRLPFSLDPQISTYEHNSLREDMESFYSKLDRLMGHLCVICETDENIGTKMRSLDEVITQTLGCLEQALLALAFHLVPSQTPAARRSAPQSRYKAWFLPFKHHFFLASFNLRDTAHSFFEEVKGSDSNEQ